MPRCRIIGPGRAGRSFARALLRAGWDVEALLGRHDDVRAAAHGVDLLLLAVPDAAVAPVARAVAPDATTVVAHVAGSLTLDALAPHARVASVHPLRAIPTPETDLAGAWCAVAGDQLALDVVGALGGRPIVVPEERRAAYHAAAAIAANHVVALLGQVARVADSVGVPLDAFLDLTRGAVEDVAALGPARALTGPVARGDERTVALHLAALEPSERPAYEALADLARRLVAEREVVA